MGGHNNNNEDDIGTGSRDIIREQLRLQRELLAAIKPFAQMLISFGIDPVSFLNSPQGQAILSTTRQSISGEFEQGRQNLVDVLGGSGFSTQSGVGVGPLAALFNDEASAQANAVAQLLQQSLGLGMQGANLLAGHPANSAGVAGGISQARLGQPSVWDRLLAGLGVGINALGGPQRPWWWPSGGGDVFNPGPVPLPGQGGVPPTTYPPSPIGIPTFPG